LTDFRIEGLEIEQLNWGWKKAEEKEEVREKEVVEVKSEKREGEEAETEIKKEDEVVNEESNNRKTASLLTMLPLDSYSLSVSQTPPTNLLRKLKKSTTPSSPKRKLRSEMTKIHKIKVRLQTSTCPSMESFPRLRKKRNQLSFNLPRKSRFPSKICRQLLRPSRKESTLDQKTIPLQKTARTRRRRFERSVKRKRRKSRWKSQVNNMNQSRSNKSRKNPNLSNKLNPQRNLRVFPLPPSHSLRNPVFLPLLIPFLRNLSLFLPDRKLLELQRLKLVRLLHLHLLHPRPAKTLAYESTSLLPSPHRPLPLHRLRKLLPLDKTYLVTPEHTHVRRKKLNRLRLLFRQTGSTRRRKILSKSLRLILPFSKRKRKKIWMAKTSMEKM